MRITLLRTWISNIGNGFIDKGAKMILSRAFPNAEITEVSGFPNYVGDIRASYGLKQKLGLDRTDHQRLTHPDRQRAVNVAEFIDTDLIVVPGCTLYDWVLRKFAPTFERLPTDDTPVFFLGAGGGNYKSETQKETRKYLNKFGVDALFSRDSNAYGCYKNDVEHAYNGIDCAFFIDEWYDPPQSTEPISAYTFDKVSEPEDLSTEGTVIRPNHAPFGHPQTIHVKENLKNVLGKGSYNAKNVLYSDLLEDYLFVYANASVTHSDRIHACVPALVYGGKSKFYYSTPRAALFDEVLSDDITTELVTLDQNKLDLAKKELVTAVENTYQNIEQA